jgi:hypothetical protein
MDRWFAADLRLPHRRRSVVSDSYKNSVDRPLLAYADVSPEVPTRNAIRKVSRVLKVSTGKATLRAYPNQLERHHRVIGRLELFRLFTLLGVLLLPPLRGDLG